MKKQSKSLKINTPLFISNHYKDIDNYTYDKKKYSIMSVVRNNQLEHYLVTKKEDKDFSRFFGYVNYEINKTLQVLLQIAIGFCWFQTEPEPYKYLLGKMMSWFFYYILVDFIYNIIRKYLLIKKLEETDKLDFLLKLIKEE